MTKRTKVFVLAAILFLLALLIALGLDAGLSSLRIYRNLQSAKDSLSSALDELHARNFPAASTAFAEAEGQLDQARSEFSRHPISMGAAKAIPYIATQVEATENFIGIAYSLTQTGNRLCEIGTGFPGLDPNAPSENLSIGQMVDLMYQFQTELGPIEEGLSAAQAVSSLMDGQWLIPPAAKAKGELDEKLDSASKEIENARELMAAFSNIMGPEGSAPNRYMFVLQDCYELRGSGGLMSTYGILNCNHDSIKLVECNRASTLTAGTDIGDAMPQPLKDFYPKVPSWTLHFWDAGWWPDFPTTAGLMDQILAANNQDPVRGYIAIDPVAIGYALHQLGPLQLPEFNEVLTEDNLAEKCLYYLEIDSQSSKSQETQMPFLRSLANSFFQRIVSATPKEWFALAQALGQALDEKHLFLYSSDPEVQRTFSALDWSGEINKTGSDFLMAVDCNIGGNDTGYKANLFMKGNLNLETVDIGDALLHRATYCFDNTRGTTFYYSYLRFYVPCSAIPTNDGTLTDLGEEFGKRVFAKRVEVPPGEIVAVDFEYLTPWYHSIIFQKQPGQPSLPIEVSIIKRGKTQEQKIYLTNQADLPIY